MRQCEMEYKWKGGEMRRGMNKREGGGVIQIDRKKGGERQCGWQKKEMEKKKSEMWNCKGQMWYIEGQLKEEIKERDETIPYYQTPVSF